LKQITSPCPTLKVIGAVTQGMVKREELKRMREMGRPGIDGEDVEDVAGVVEATSTPEISSKTVSSKKKSTKPKKKLPIRQRVVIVADKTVAFVLGNTVGRVARFASRRILGQVPEEAKKSSFYLEETVVETTDPSLRNLEEDAELLQQAISEQLRKDNIYIDEEDEALFAELYEETQAAETKEAATAAVESS
jgi:hypothetical protein